MTAKERLIMLYTAAKLNAQDPKGNPSPVTLHRLYNHAPIKKTKAEYALEELVSAGALKRTETRTASARAIHYKVISKGFIDQREQCYNEALEELEKARERLTTVYKEMHAFDVILFPKKESEVAL